MEKEWILKMKQANFQQLAEEYKVPPLLIKLMVNRGIDESGMSDYLSPNLSSLGEATLMKGVESASKLLNEIANKHEFIAIVTDYDCDGIFSGMVLYTGLKELGAVPKIFTPDRVRDGYGINKLIIDEIYKKGIKYIITCDNGIAAYDEIEYANSLGMKVIITDHHEVPYTGNGVPNAYAVCNPKQIDCEYEFKGLCGAGVALRLVDHLYDQNKVAANKRNELLEYVTIATIADVMELTKENRALVKEGLRLLSNTSSPGLRAIIKVNELEDKPISVYHIGFVIGPCFNAAGRLETADLAFRLLRSTDDLEAEALALQLKRLNDERKHLTELAMNRGIELAESPQYNADHVLVIPLEDCHESIVGIVAGRIKEHTGKPTIVLAQVASDYSKGSGRSIPAYSMYEEMARFSDLFVKFGGHAMAAGLTICNQNIDKLRERLNSRQQLTEKDFIQKIYIDAEVVFRHMTESVVKYLYMLEPYGNGNQKPIFASRHIKIQRAVRLGKNKNVLKMYLEDAMGDVLEAIMFQGVEEFLEFIGDEFGQEQRTNVLQGYNNEVELAFSFFPDINEYKGRKNVQLIIQDYKRMKRSGCV